MLSNIWWIKKTIQTGGVNDLHGDRVESQRLSLSNGTNSSYFDAIRKPYITQVEWRELRLSLAWYALHYAHNERHQHNKKLPNGNWMHVKCNV